MINAAFELRSEFYPSIAISCFQKNERVMVLKSTVLKPTLLIRLTGIFCFTVNRGCAVGADSLNGKKDYFPMLLQQEAELTHLFPLFIIS